MYLTCAVSFFYFCVFFYVCVGRSVDLVNWVSQICFVFFHGNFACYDVAYSRTILIRCSVDYSVSACVWWRIYVVFWIRCFFLVFMMLVALVVETVQFFCHATHKRSVAYAVAQRLSVSPYVRQLIYQTTNWNKSVGQRIRNVRLPRRWLPWMPSVVARYF